MEYLKCKVLREGCTLFNPKKEGDAGFDVVSGINIKIEPDSWKAVPLGIALEFPFGYVCIVNQKSGIAKNTGASTIGNVIDSGYRGEIHAIIVNNSAHALHIKKGEKIAQLLFHKVYTPKISFYEVLSDSERGKDGGVVR